MSDKYWLRVYVDAFENLPEDDVPEEVNGEELTLYGCQSWALHFLTLYREKGQVLFQTP